jgi:transcriptional regulator with XRE-family HTH domain
MIQLVFLHSKRLGSMTTAPDDAIDVTSIRAKMDALGLSCGQLAIAAGLHKTTLYRILDGTSTHPHYSTRRRLARALQIPITQLTNQLEAQALDEHLPADDALYDLLLKQFRILTPELRLAGAQVAVSAMLDVDAGTGRRPNPRPGVRRLIRDQTSPNERAMERLMRRLLARIPRLLQRIAVREAIRAMIDVQLRLGQDPSQGLYDVAAHPGLHPAPRHYWSREKARRERDKQDADTG